MKHFFTILVFLSPLAHTNDFDRAKNKFIAIFNNKDRLLFQNHNNFQQQNFVGLGKTSTINKLLKDMHSAFLLRQSKRKKIFTHNNLTLFISKFYPDNHKKYKQIFGHNLKIWFCQIKTNMESFDFLWTEYGKNKDNNTEDYQRASACTYNQFLYEEEVKEFLDALTRPLIFHSNSIN